LGGAFLTMTDYLTKAFCFVTLCLGRKLHYAHFENLRSDTYGDRKLRHWGRTVHKDDHSSVEGELVHCGHFALAVKTYTFRRLWYGMF